MAIPVKNKLSGLISSGIVKSIIETIGTRGGLIALGFLFSVIVTRILGPEKKGLLAVTVSITTIGIQFGNLGLHSANVFYVAQRKSLLPVLLGNSLFVGLFGGSIIALLGFLLITAVPSLVPVSGVLIVLPLVSIPFGLARQLSDNLLVGIQDIRGYNLNEIFLQLSMILFTVFILLMDMVSVKSILAVQLIAFLLSLCLVLFRLGMPVIKSISLSLKQFVENIKYGMKSYVASLADNLFNQLDFLMLSFYVNAEHVGFYAIAFAIKNMIYILPSTIAMIIFPKLCEMDVFEDRWRLTKNSVLNILGALVVVSFVLYFVGKYLIILIYGKEFESTFLPLMLLLPGLLFISIDNVLRKLLNSHKKKGFRIEITYLWVGLLVLKILLNYFLIDDYGILAVVINSNICYGISLLYIFMMVLKEHKENLIHGTQNI